MNTIKFFITTLILLINLVFLSAQKIDIDNEKYADADISFDIDNSVFDKTEFMGTVMYESNTKHYAFLQVMLIPKSYDYYKKTLASYDFTIVENTQNIIKKTIKSGNKEAYMISYQTNNAEDELVHEIYVIKNNNNTTIMITNDYDLSEKLYFGEAGKFAVFSAKVLKY
ncbi:hypothetical protein TRIP_D300028 [uncultured Paludibacter sp.]|uniref:PsbP C-terminal domain-containing protein n=1 Tax=uncultured Paludibacter sp. TaxID=497635 RepID=A0A653ABE4_9BACT|nr:hypothetical protein TRIP_D300028 [uncultured Paludibacter sp.]